MAIFSLRINDFRNLANVKLEPCRQGLNIISGANGSGKTSLLEAIHYLGVGRSFRSSVLNRLVRDTTEKFSIFSQLVTDIDTSLPLGVERDLAGDARLRLAEKEVTTFAEFAALLPLRVINSHSHNLLESGPQFRRKYLDWGLFYHDEGFFTCWRLFERALKQRNILLRDRRPKNELDGWTNELIKYGDALNSMRCQYIQQLMPVLMQIVEILLPSYTISMSYQNGWDDAQPYEAILHTSFLNEIRAGYTLYGPHRADLVIEVNGVPAKHILSRGQQKLLICAMILAQGQLFAKSVNKEVIYLVDDLPAELDDESRRKLVMLLVEQKTQVFITAIEQAEICDFFTDKQQITMKLFHVEHGRIAEM